MRLVVVVVDAAEFEYRIAGPFEKIVLRFTVFEPHGGAKCYAREQRDWQELLPRQNAIHVIEIDRHEFDIGAFLADVIEPALEFTDLFATATATFWKYNHRMGVAHFSQHEIDRTLMNLKLAAINEHRVISAGNVSSQHSFAPIVFGSHRTREPSDMAGKRRPNEHDIDVASVVGEIDALARVGLAVNPTNAGAAHKPRQPGEHQLRQHVSSRTRGES